MITTDLVEITNNKSVYSPREDSYLMMNFVLETINGDAVEIGCGTGLSILSLAKKNQSKNYFAIDINYKATILTNYNSNQNRISNIQVVCADSVKSFRREGLPGTLFFNPPYLPEDPVIDKYLSKLELAQFTGGKKGYELTSKIIEQLEDGDILYVIISSLSITPEQIQRLHSAHFFELKSKSVMDDGEILWLLKARKLR